MPLALSHEQNMDRPIVICDHCGQEIRCAAEGNYQWLDSDRPARLYFTHKACCHAFEKRHGGSWYAMELNWLPAYLVNNLEIDWPASQRVADYLSRW